MPSQTITSWQFYGAIVLTLTAWWLCAFRAHDKSIGPSSLNNLSTSSLPPLIPGLSAMNRESLKLALGGDISLIIKLLAEWDIDAQILQHQGVRGAHRLSPRSYLQAQILGRKLHQAHHDLQADPNTKFLPQTYVSASYLLALAEPHEIMALPKGLREQVHLYPRQLTDKIPQDTNQFQAEKLHLSPPKLAFVADYSHPATLEALKSQGIPLLCINAPKNLKEISETLIHVGTSTDHTRKAELLQFFIEGALLAIDNRLAALQHSLGDNTAFPKILFLNHHSQFSIPGKETLTAQLLQRLGIPHLCDSSTLDSIPMEYEQIIGLNPDTIVIGTTHLESLQQKLFNDSVFQPYLKKARNRLHVIDSSIQETPTQYAILAYYDIFHALQASVAP